MIDRDYTGNISVLLFNHGDQQVTLPTGDHVAQLIPERYATCLIREVDNITDTTRGTDGFGSTSAAFMEPELVEIFAINLMPLATKETLRKLIPEEYHDYLNVFDPEGPMCQLPPLRPGYDFEIQLNPSKPLPQPARPYHMSPAERKDWIKWCDTMLAARLIAPAPANTPVCGKMR